MHTFAPGPSLTGYDRASLSRIADIFVLEHCYAAVAARTQRRPKRTGVTKYTFSLCPHRSHRKSGCFVTAGDRLTISYLVVSNTDNIDPVKPALRAEVLPVHTGSIPNTEPQSTASTGEYP